MLKTAFVQGRLTKHELDVRVGQTLVSRTWADLVPLTADIPAWAIHRPVRRPAKTPSSPSTFAVVRAVACAIIGVAAIALAGMPGVWTIPAPASLTAQACQTYFRWGGPEVGSFSTLAVAAMTARNGSDPRLAIDLQTLLAAAGRSEVVSNGRAPSAIRNVALHHTQTDSIRVESDCLADGSPPTVP